MSEQKTITLTVPFRDDPIRRADGALWDGTGRTGAAKDGRSIAVLHADIGAALLASWPGEATSDYAKRLAEIEATFAAWDWHCDDDADPANDPGVGAVQALRDLEGSSPHQLRWLLAQHRAASEALAALGIPDDGRPLAERMADLGKTLRGALHDAGLLRDMQGRKCHDDHAVAAARRDADILKRAARAAAIAGGEDVPEDAGPEAVAAALRRSTERAKVTAADLGDALREAQAELARRADPNGTWAKLEALAGKAAGIAAEVDSKG